MHQFDRSIFPKEAAITELDLDLAGKVAKTLAGNETIKELIKSPFLTPDQLKLLASTVIEEAAAALGVGLIALPEDTMRIEVEGFAGVDSNRIG